MTITNTIATITNPAVRHDFVIVMRGELCNPNGDPNAGNAPRQLPDNRVYTTGTSLSSRINQTAELLYGAKVLYKHGTNLDEVQKQYDTPTALMKDFWDRRGNGGLFASYGKDKKNAIEVGFRGIYRLYPMVSLEVPNLVEQAITSPTTNSKGNRTMGNATYADRVVARGTGTYNACLNIKRGNTVDAEYMGQWLVCLWQHPIMTASLQRGEWEIVDVVIATHNNAYGNLQLSKVDGLVTVEGNGVVSVADAPEGITITRLSDVIDDLTVAYPPTIAQAS